MKRTLVVIAAIGLLFTTQIASAGGNTNLPQEGSSDTFTLAAYGDWPYSLSLLAQAPALLNSINSDPQVHMVIHVGDIHGGNMPCTGVGLDPRPATADPNWNQTIFNIFQQFQDPVIYTPGDNEWTDCHKTRAGSSGAPLNELASIRSLFFAHPGQTLGQQAIRLTTQAQKFDAAHPTDAQFVENLRWQKLNVVFVTLNVPGSNNDGLPWNGGAGAFLNEPARQQEVAERTAADMRWLQAAFEQAEAKQAGAVVVILQADLWDLSALAPGGDGLTGYRDLVQVLANLSIHFGRPVLLINGDSHIFEADHPLADPLSVTGRIYGTLAVPNLTRLTVEGAIDANEWLRLTVNPHSPEVFSWERIQYLP